nr:transcription factor rfx3 [Hymenolepis microstoma]
MQPGSSQGATVIQITKNPISATHTIIQQNGQHLLVGKISNSVSAPTSDATEIVSDSNTNGGGVTVQTLLPAQYVETASAEPTVYATAVSTASGGNAASSGTSGQVQYQEYAPIIYTPVCGSQTYYQTIGGQVLASSNFAGAGTTAATNTGAGTAQLVTHQGTTYILQSATGSFEDDSAALSHTAKASPVTVQWLLENYETAEGVSLPRSTLYFHYLQHCQENKLEPMNPASFGKLIRSVFLGLRTRRLGTRGNSKYHYYGIRIKPTSQLNHYVEDPSFALRHYPNYHRESMEVVAEWKNLAGKSSIPGSTIGSSCAPSSSPMKQGGIVSLGGNENSCGSGSAFGDPSNNTRTSGTATIGSPISSDQNRHQHAEFLGKATSALPNLNEICRSAGLPVPGSEDVDLSSRNRSPSGGINSGFAVKKASTATASSSSGLDGVPTKDLIKFVILYAQSAGNILEAVVNLDFSSIAGAWKMFWRTGECNEDSVFEKTLSKERLYALAKNIVVHQFIRLYDHTFYQSLAEVLIPNVLRPIPSSLTQAIRNFAKHLEVWMREALQDLDPVLLRIKLGAVSALGQTLRRYTSLNHLAQAARAVLKNPTQINQMLIDLSRVDFNNVQEQASWVCQCSDATVAHLEQDFKYILQKQSSLEEWAQWLDTVVTGILRPLEGNNLAYTRSAHQLILKWSYYSSMVIRDLTLRSAASFGSFHLIRLLYDEYIFYLVEHKVAAHLGMTPIAVMGEMGRAVTRPHCNLSRATATALVANTEPRSREDIPSTIPSVCGKLEAVLTANKEAASDIDATDNTAQTLLHQDTEDSVTDVTICEAFEAEAVFQRPNTEGHTGEHLEEEFLDGEEEILDDAEDELENAMLCRAHESALKAAAAEAHKSSSTNGDSSDNGNGGMINEVPAAGTVQKREEESAVSGVPVVLKEALKVEEPPASRQHQQQNQEGCDSPPPIVAHATALRKVVRVTTFDESGGIQKGVETTDQQSTTPATSLIIPSEAKRPRLI